MLLSAGVTLVPLLATVIISFSEPGAWQEVLTDAGAHLLRSELGGVSIIGGLFPRLLPAQRGAMDLDALAAALRPEFTPDKPATALVWMETTHNDAGAAVLPLHHMQAVGEAARRRGVPTHVDGARFLNAAVALGANPADLAATLYTALGIDPERKFLSPDGRPIRLVENGTPPRELVGGL